LLPDPGVGDAGARSAPALVARAGVGAGLRQRVRATGRARDGRQSSVRLLRTTLNGSLSPLKPISPLPKLTYG
jgi:hypothetical protein